MRAGERKTLYVITVCDLSAAREDWLDTLGASGMRIYAAPMFRSGRWYTPNGHEEWDEKAGRDGLDRALRLSVNPIVQGTRRKPATAAIASIDPRSFVSTQTAMPTMFGPGINWQRLTVSAKSCSLIHRR
jgi:hypothetical protein